jgi:hypothetical protein
MLQEVARKHPAVVVHAEPGRTRALSADRVLIRTKTRAGLAAEVSRRWRAGEIERSYRTGRLGQYWVAEVTLKPHRTWLVRHGWKVGLAGVTAGGVGVGFYFLAQALVMLLPYLAALLAVLALVAVFGGGTTIIQKNIVNR